MNCHCKNKNINVNKILSIYSCFYHSNSCICNKIGIDVHYKKKIFIFADIDSYLLELAGKITTEWKRLAIFLHIKDEKINQIDINQIDVVWKGYTMLKVWWDSGGNEKLWYEELARAFHRIGKGALAQKIVTEGPNVTINNEM